MEDKFQLYRKWFWVGIAVGALNMLLGIIYGIAVWTEPPGHRKEGVIIIFWSVLAFLFLYYVVGPWLAELGVLPNLVLVPEQVGQQPGVVPTLPTLPAAQ
ncbi:MAG: hypothetical protein A2745_01645 [Candidatus Harrisonbacteria bacterium RIFCSPHIGHO2_01_FULL_44_13]|uniref:Uncharacterized protein n=1 Tax=Candidatus Harrisonbacteria bacterium RIFCSPLOWO2_01_FULL_44_18 TaxID=1798407 RepID=A0A1G1ZN42_9BACT|nr:MAG: hypothetical protein A2745_01645 [Candidatus Harrisonbacteria bacterium RIFCSPHIGHO2_01_FULL_44_13]OGY65180.1 MAG: hypothetical protein A3A16_00605 [Candidatus Harrisonbacteria bacterium RIFCSPLOWO2_01_FULL_44_18]